MDVRSDDTRCWHCSPSAPRDNWVSSTDHVQRHGDVAKVARHGSLRPIGIPLDQCLYQVSMLIQGLLRATRREEDRPILEPHQLGVEHVQQTLGRGVATRLDDACVEPTVGVEIRPQITAFDLRAHLGVDRLYGGEVVIGRRDRRVAGGKTLEHGSRLGDLDGLALANGPHMCATVRFADNETFVLQSEEHGADHASTRAEAGTEVRFDEPLLGEQFA